MWAHREVSTRGLVGTLAQMAIRVSFDSVRGAKGQTRHDSNGTAALQKYWGNVRMSCLVPD